MYVEYHVLDEAAKQLRESIGTSIPLDPPGWSGEDTETLRSVLEEVCWGDLIAAVRNAADRLPDPRVSAEERSDDTKNPSKITEVG